MAPPADGPDTLHAIDERWELAEEPLVIDEELSIPFWRDKTEGSKRVHCPSCDKDYNKAAALKRHYTGVHLNGGKQKKRIRRPARNLDGHERAAALARLRASQDPPPAASPTLASEPAIYLEPMDVDTEAPRSINSANGNIDWVISTPDLLENSGLAVLETFKAILCTECQQCVPSRQALGHLRRQHGFTSLSSSDFDRFVHQQGLDLDPRELLRRVRERRQFEQCDLLAQVPGWWCEECGYATASVQQSVEHQRRPGHPFSRETVHVDGKDVERDRAVVQGTVQTLFAVKFAGLIPSIPIPTDTSTSASDIFRQVVKLNRSVFEPPIIAQKDPRSVHPFIRISGFQRWIDHKGRTEVERLQKLMKPLAQPWGKRLVSHCQEMLRLSFELCTAGNYVARCQVNSPNTVIETSPFGELATEEAQNRYCSAWAGLIAYLINCAGDPDEKRGFGLSLTQESQLGVYMNLLFNRNSNDGMAIEALVYLSGCLFFHEFAGDSNTDHPLIAYTILSSTKPGNVIANPVHISPFLARIEYFCRVTVMVYASLATSHERSFFSAVKELCRWVKEGENTPFAWVRQMLHLTATFVHGTNQMPRFVWGLDNSESYTFDGYKIYVKEFISLVRGSVQDAVGSFFGLWASYGLSDDLLLTSLDDVGDQLASRSTNYNFARHPVNVSLQNRAEDCLDRAIDSGIFCRKKRVNGEDRLLWHPHSIRQRLEMSKKFLLTLAVALYLASGQPPRGTELLATLITNIDTRVRNGFLSNGRMLLCHFLNKTTFLLKSDKAIVRELCSALSLVLANYIAFLRPIESKLAGQVGVDEANVVGMQKRLFQIGSHSLETDALSEGLKRQWRKVVTRYGDAFPGWGTADTRQNAIYVGKRWVKTPKMGDDGEAIFDLQAGHCSAVAQKWYGVDANRLGGDIDLAILELFRCLSRAHHSAYGLEEIAFQRRNDHPPPPENPLPPLKPITHVPDNTEAQLADEPPAPSYHTHPSSSGAPIATSSLQPTALAMSDPQPPAVIQAGDHPPAFNEEAFSSQIMPFLQTTITKALEKLSTEVPLSKSLAQDALSLSGSSGSIAPAIGVSPAQVGTAPYNAMQEILGNKGRFRSVEQALAVQAAWERKNHVLAVLPTGGGKSLVAEVTSRLERGEGMLNVIMVPLKALADDLKARFTDGNLMVEIWQGPGTPWCQVLIAIFEDAGKESFINLLKRRIEEGTLGRLFVDECHYAVFSNPDFRPGMQALSELVILGAQVVLLTATAPLARTGKLLEFYGVPQATVIRASTNRPNIRYCTYHLPSKPHGMSQAQFAYNAIKSAMDKYREYYKGDRVLVYMMSKPLIDEVLKLALADPDMAESPWVKYHAGMSEDERKEAVSLWVSVMLASSAFSVGVNPQNCGLVIHYEAPRSMLDYVQESGRAGRDGKRAVAALLWQRKPEPCNDEEAIMASYLETKLCYRWVLFRYMDGTAANCFSLPGANRLCSNCATAWNASQETKKTPPAPHEVGHIITCTAEAASATPFTELLNRMARWAKGMSEGCAKCYLEGHAPRARHRYGVWNCPTGAFNGDVMNAYINEFKPTWHAARTGDYASYMCTLCWLPKHGDTYHDHTKPRGNKQCIYIDLFGHLAWAAYHDPKVKEEFKKEHPGADADTLADWGEWISSPNSLRAPRFWDLAAWVDRRNATYPGKAVFIS
ncbi:hypothetical protein FRC00_008030 [Tulasnella sp. 408]|nr:hypothetical protein FRC00_008030 [Tulasnella sp. 408]